ncbi:MAG: NADH-quinone oxidoreductase subunit L [Rhodobacteraceae bacterium]|nr:NADH-quinone oxidoreductase subunit L [Paracoccaceae bacterium]
MELFVLFAPLIGGILAGFGWKILGEKAAIIVSTSLLFVACFVSWFLFLEFDGELRIIKIFKWMSSGSLEAFWAIRFDRLTAVMLIVVTTVSALVHLYSVGYMDHDPNWSESETYKPRFFAYLSFFTFAMLMLVTSDNLLQMFFGWEGVGVASYLLIGFYYKKPTANAAAIKAFVVNRVGDFGFALGIFGIFFLTGSIQFSDIFYSAQGLSLMEIRFLWADWNAANLVAFLLFVGAMGKSAQLFLHTWLPDAMEGPTPVSALIHAATMVTAGVFLVCRMSPVMEFAPDAMAFVTFIGATTAFFAASIGLVQNDIKRVIAYSTCSQLGYMFVAAGSGVYSVAMFHLFTHAFFKALLFLGAGSVIHAMHHEQDMRNYGGLRKKIPYTFAAMMIGTLAITGVGIPLTHYGFAGFLSKDAIIESAYAASLGGYSFWMLVLSALFTSFYSWRLIFMTFYGDPRGDSHTHSSAHESPKTMLIPLAVLSLGAIFSGMIWYKSFFGDHYSVNKFFGIQEAISHSLDISDGAGRSNDNLAVDVPIGAIYMAPDNHILDEAHHVPKWVKLSPFVAMIIGFLLSYIFYIWRTDVPRKLAQNQRYLYSFLLNKWYFDEIYEILFVRSARFLGRFLWKKGDGQTIDGFINNFSMVFIPLLTKLAGRAQSGYIFTYAFAMVLGIVVLITWMTLGAGG